MKKLLYAGLLLMSLPAAAQSIRIIPEVGLQMSNQTTKITFSGGAGKGVGDVKPGLRAGISIDAPLSRYFSLQPGVFYSQRGLSEPSGSGKARIDYVEIPLNLLVKAPFHKGRLFLGGGPYLAIGVGGEYTNSTGTHDIIFGDDRNSAQLKRLDAGLNFCGGFEAANGVVLRGFATAGLANIAAGGSSDYSVHNWGYGFSIGYLIR